MDLHIGYETVEPFALERIEAGPSAQPAARTRGEGASERAEAPKPMLKADLLMRVTRVSVETQAIVEAMKAASR